ncbi:MAG TPA: hypothetical protein VG456_23290 [Candidatus Sulfopaludibacter sp.]|jgi:hypothetical protein|nr:hypothetical protein [Candidatus Sulfopaludibacter sp.]
MAAPAGSLSLISRREAGWIYKPSWDLPLLIFSAVLVPLPFLIAWLSQVSGWMKPQQAIDAINIAVATLVGGPHLFSTITFTFLDPRFRKQYRWYANLAFLLPAGVVWLGVYHYEFLITFFFSWASLHVLHQVIYMTDCYRARSPVREPKWSRIVDYGLILTALYPVGIYKLSLRRFLVGGVVLPYPVWLRSLPLAQAAAVVFTVFLTLWVGKTILEFRDGRAAMPKTLLIGITTLVSFCLPLGSNLDVLFQGYNTWHSFQYLFLLWLINRLRENRGELQDGFVRRLVRRDSMGAYYLCFLAATGVMVLLTLMVRAVTNLSPDRSYFVVVLSVLLMHYYFDHFLFSQPQLIE